MTRKYERSVLSLTVLSVLFWIAFVIQFTKDLPLPSEVLTALWTVRNGIHLTLMFVWCGSVKRRIVSRPVRRMLIGVGCLMAFWLVVRTCKWEYISAPTDVMGRYCWYGYYVPIILIPLLGVFIVDHIGRPEGYHCPRWMMLLYIPAALLVGGVFTNDLHRLAFSFPKGFPYYNNVYQYGPIYFLTMGWFVGWGFYFVVTLMRKSRITGYRRFRKLPLAIMVFAVAFWTVYALGLQDCDLTAINCLIITLLLESAIQSGLIPANTNYQALFQMSTCPMQILDSEGQVCYRSEAASDMVFRPKDAPVYQENSVTYCKPISGGYVLWRDDVRQINILTGQLKERQGALNEDNSLLKSEAELRKKRSKTAEMIRLYDSVSQSVAKQLAEVDRCLKLAEERPEERRTLLARVCVFGAYIKRRGNLVLLREQGDTVPVKELEYCLRESLDNLRLSGVFTSLNADVTGRVTVAQICAAYDWYEELVEALYGRITAMLIHLADTDGAIRLRLQVGCDAPVSEQVLSGLTTAMGSVRYEIQDEDLLLNLIIAEGGGAC